MLKLQYTDGSQKGVWLIEPRQRLGSDRRNDLVISAGDDIGDFHAEVHINGDTLRLEPLGGHACEVNGTRIAGATPIKLGDVVKLGRVELRVLDPRQSTVKKPAPAATLVNTSALTTAAMATGTTGWTLAATVGGKRWPLKGTQVVGRASDCDITLSHDRMSRKHAELRESAGTLFLRDLGSANGTFLNDQPVKGEAVRVRAGDRVRFDMLAFVIEGPAAAAADDMNKTVVRPAIDATALKQAAPVRPAARPAARPVAEASRAASQQPAEERSRVGLVVIGVVVLAAAVGAVFFLMP